MFKQRLADFLGGIRHFHANGVQEQLGYHLHLMKRHPEVVLSHVNQFRYFLESAPADNVEPALRCLGLIAESVPEARDQIIKDMGDLLYEYKGIIEDLPYRGTLEHLLAVLEIPVSKGDQQLRDIARSVVSLKRSMIVVIGAGFSYDSMPITKELEPLLVTFLRDAGEANPMELIRDDDRKAWEIIKGRENEFKRMFAAWCAKSTPSFQHTMVSELLQRGQISHLISFNWDDLCERAYKEQFKELLEKVTYDTGSPDRPILWKLHGDVEDLASEWVFPYEAGRVFDSLVDSLDQTIKAKPPSHALIVGYGEWESEVKEKLMGWLERNVRIVLRVRPNWPNADDKGIRDSAKKFFLRLHAYMGIESRGTK